MGTIQKFLDCNADVGRGILGLHIYSFCQSNHSHNVLNMHQIEVLKLETGK